MRIEERILKLMERNAHHTTGQIAAMLGVDEAEVKDKIAKLEKERVILGYTTLINWEKFGDEGITAMIEVKVAPEREKGFDAIAERICRFPEVRSVYLMSGTYDLSVIVQGRNLKDVSAFVTEKLATLDRVQSTTTHFILKRYKEDNIIFDDKEEDRRLMVSP